MKDKSSFLSPKVSPIFLLVLVLVFFGIPVGETADTQGVSKDTIKIGMTFDQTGPTVSIQGPIADAFKLYFRHINDQGGINGRKVKCIHEDDRYMVAQQVAAFKKLIYRDEVFALFQGGSSGGLLAILPMIMKQKVPTLAPPTNDKLVIPPRRYFFAAGVTYEDEIKIVFDYMFNVLKAKNPRIAIARPDTEHGKIGSVSAHEQAKLYGVELVSEVVISPGALEASSQVINLKMAKADYVIAHMTDTNTTALVRDSRKLGFSPTFVGTKYAGGETVVKLGGKAAEKFYITSPFVPWYEDTPGMVELRKITLRYFPGTEKEERPAYYTQGWACGMIMAEVLKKAGKSPTREGLVEAFESLKDFDTGGISGLVTFDPNNHKGGNYCKIYKADIEKKRLVPVTSWLKPKEMN